MEIQVRWGDGAMQDIAGALSRIDGAKVIGPDFALFETRGEQVSFSCRTDVIRKRATSLWLASVGGANWLRHAAALSKLLLPIVHETINLIGITIYISKSRQNQNG